jgi:hypothetical protein
MTLKFYFILFVSFKTFFFQTITITKTKTNYYENSSTVTVFDQSTILLTSYQSTLTETITNESLLYESTLVLTKTVKAFNIINVTSGTTTITKTIQTTSYESFQIETITKTVINFGDLSISNSGNSSKVFLNFAITSILLAILSYYFIY